MKRTDFSELELTLSTGWVEAVKKELCSLISSQVVADAIIDFIIKGELSGLNGIDCCICRNPYRRHVSLDSGTFNIKLEGKSSGSLPFPDNSSGDLILTVTDTDGVWPEIYQRWCNNYLFEANMTSELMYVEAE